MSTKILVVDDDINICEAIKLYLVNEGYEVKTANDGEEGIKAFKSFEPDLVLLDIMMPKKDGKQTCREIREISNKPIIMVTAKDEVFDKVLLLELGADDYLVKPFDMKELSVRIKAVLRRYQSIDNKTDDECVTFDNIEISLSKYELKIKGKVEDIPLRNCNFFTSLRQTTTEFSHAISFLTKYGDLIISAIRERLMFT